MSFFVFDETLPMNNDQPIDTEELKEGPVLEAEPRRPLIFFSGGLDSTYLLYLQLQISDVDVVYANGGQTELKQRAEEIAREAVIGKLHDMFPYRVRRQIEVSARLRVQPGGWWEQPLSWFRHAIEVVNPKTHSEIRVGTLMGDQFASRAPYMADAWRQLCYATMSKEFPAPELVYPLIHTTKETILKELPKELLALTWSCETPMWSEEKGITECELCLPCLTRAMYVKHMAADADTVIASMTCNDAYRLHLREERLNNLKQNYSAFDHTGTNT